MSEMPEVETLMRDLCRAVVGRPILRAEVLLPAAVRFPTPAEFSSLLENRTVLDANRRAKHILVRLSGELMLGLHMMLWGTLRLTPVEQPRDPTTLIVFHLDRDEDLLFMDSLGYARAALAAPDELAERLDLASLGPEIIAPEFSVERLAEQLRRRKAPLKTLLLNQKVLAGLGNRDADESLWRAGIDPRRTAASLTAEEQVRLHEAMRFVLQEGIDLRGSQRDLFGQYGRARHRRNIFERTGEPCPRCGTPVARVRIGGRNTHYCPVCQT